MQLSANDTPSVPNTPSSTINKMLAARCGKKYDNVVKGALAYYICGFFHVITTFYNAINMDTTRHSHRMWITACTVISCLIVLKAYLLYNIIMASAFVMHTLLYYGSVSLGLFGVGLGVSGAIFFDKDGEDEKKTETKRPPLPSNPPPVKKFSEGAKVVPEMVKKIEKPTAPKTPAPAAVTPTASTPTPTTPTAVTSSPPAPTSQTAPAAVTPSVSTPASPTAPAAVTSTAPTPVTPAAPPQTTSSGTHGSPAEEPKPEAKKDK